LVSYPFTAAGFYIARAWFFIRLVLVLVTLALSASTYHSARQGQLAALVLL
jgi:hypothetical protein